MSTLDNINENIINKIDYIDKINDILFYKYKLNIFICMITIFYLKYFKNLI